MRPLLIVSAFAAVFLPGMAHGLWTGRWNLTEEPEASASRLERLPLTVADWQGRDIELDRRAIARASIAGYLARLYTQRDGKGQVLVFLACGRPGPVAVHSPDICYQGSGFRMVGEKKKHTVEIPESSIPAQFFTGKFEKKLPTGDERLQIYWAWKAGGSWQAPAQPRWTFGAQPVLHKLYVVQPLTGPGQVADDTCLQFMKAVIPEMERSLFAS